MICVLFLHTHNMTCLQQKEFLIKVDANLSIKKKKQEKLALLPRRIFARAAWKYVENTKLSYIFQSTTVFYTNTALPLLQNLNYYFFKFKMSLE